MTTTTIVKEALLFLFIALSPIEDFFLQATPLRSLGASPSLFPLLALAGIAFGEWLASGRLRVNRLLLIGLAYAFVVTLYGLFFFGVVSLGESLLWKSVKAFVELALVVFAANNIDYRVTPIVRIAIYVAFSLVIVGFCFGAANPFGLPPVLENNPILHFTPLPDTPRPRGLQSEPSVLSMSAIVFGLLAAHVARTKLTKALLIVTAVAVLIASGSKGGILTLFLCLMVLSVVRWHSRWYHVLAILFILLPLGLFLVYLVPNLFPQSEISLFPSVASRSSMIVCALITVRHHPFGVGLGAFLPSVVTYLPGAMYTVQSYSPVPLPFGEVGMHLTSPEMVSTMTFFFDQLIYFGIPFALCFFVFVTTLLRRLTLRKKTILVVAVLASTIALSTYAGIGGFYGFPILFGVALCEVRNMEKAATSQVTLETVPS